MGFRVLGLSSVAETGIEELRGEIEGRAVVFSGPSGAGKTSLLRKLLSSEEVGRVGEVSTATGKGKHTTTAAILLGGPGGSEWIDTPGVREFGLGEIPPARLASLFLEFRDLACAQAGCLHLDEEGCSARPLERYASYRRILTSLIAGEN
jgi:ribosome biogenesis GTPase